MSISNNNFVRVKREFSNTYKSKAMISMMEEQGWIYRGKTQNDKVLYEYIGY
jgi:hypothetical protein